IEQTGTSSTAPSHSPMPVQSPSAENTTPKPRILNAPSAEILAKVANLSKPSRSDAYKTAFAELVSLGDDAVPAILTMSAMPDLANYNAIIPELMAVLGKINTPLALSTLQTLREKGMTTAVQMAALQTLRNIGQI
ncbi:MAG: hypothetical protein AAFN11_21570, partial [Chloroflexota bacterium]